MKQLGGYYLEEEELRSLGFLKVGENAKVHSSAHIYGLENVHLGANCRIDDFALIVASGELIIGNHVSIHSHCFIGSKYGISLGNFTTLAPGVKIFSSSDDYSGKFMTGPTISGEFTGGDKGFVTIGHHVIIGAGSIILPGVTISDGVSVGSLSLVKNDLSEWKIFGGIPAHEIKKRDPNLLKLVEKLSERD
jgi:acetyltransferase-like isoleucine patch superfamily enzyme